MALMKLKFPDKPSPLCGRFFLKFSVPLTTMNLKTHRPARNRGFALVITLSLMVLITLIAVGMLGLSTIEVRKSTQGEARAAAMANARLALMLAIGELQSSLGDDRRISADASVFATTNNPAAVGTWNGWSPDLASKSASSSTPRVDYLTPKKQAGFRGWLVSAPEPAASTSLLDWHVKPPESGKDHAKLFTAQGSGFDLGGGKVAVSSNGSDKVDGTFAWAVSQENTKARINVGANDQNRVDPDDRLQAPARPSLALSDRVKDPGGDWTNRPVLISSLSQAVLEPGYGLTRETAGQAARDYTVDSNSLLTDSVKGGLKVDLSTGFELSDSEFAATNWSGDNGSVTNPFTSATPKEYKGQKPLFQQMMNSAQAQVYMPFEAASVNHKFQVNGVPTFNTLRSHYRIHRHLYQGSGGETAFERPYAHIATPELVTGRPYGRKSQPSLAPVLDRMNLIFSLYAKASGELCVLLSPIVTVWNPYNVDIETEGLVVYPWIDFAVFWKWNVTPKNPQDPDNLGKPTTWDTSLSRAVGEGYQGHGRSARPYFYLHLTQSGNKNVKPAIRLAPGEVRVFVMAENARTDLNVFGNAQARTWQMKPATGPSDLTNATRSGIVLNTARCLPGSEFAYRMKSGDRLNANNVGFDRGSYHYIVNMADSYQIKNPGVELMVESRPAGNGLPALPAEKNLLFYSSIHSGRSYGKGNDSLNYPSYAYEEINETPKMVGSLLTYHRVAEAKVGALSLADMMFTTNPRQAYVSPYLSGAKFQAGPHYESLFQQGTNLTALSMQTTTDGRQAFYGASHSANTGRSHLPFFEVPRTPTLSLGALQHCDIATTPFGVSNQIGNSWASAYLSAGAVSKRVTSADDGGSSVSISPSGMAVYDYSYLANEALFDRCYFSGATPKFGSRKSGSASAGIWEDDQISETKDVTEVLKSFFEDPTVNPLRNPRMKPYKGQASMEELKSRLEGPARAVRLASHLMVEGGFNINSTSVEAWTAMLASLRGAEPASGSKTAQSRFRHILKGAPVGMAENDPWSGFRTLTDQDLEKLATSLVAEIKVRGPFLSLGEFVNRRVTTDRSLGLTGAIQAAIDKSGLNQNASYAKFTTTAYPNPENIPNPNTGTNTPGWLSQADVLTALAPYITPRSDTFIVRSMGEAKDGEGKVIARVILEAVVQRVPDFVDPVDDAATEIAKLSSNINKTFGRRFQVVSVKEIKADPDTATTI